jgi:hypothetical protein
MKRLQFNAIIFERSNRQIIDVDEEEVEGIDGGGGGRVDKKR